MISRPSDRIPLSDKMLCGIINLLKPTGYVMHQQV